MSRRQFAVAALALLVGAHAASPCCFVVQDEVHEIYWSQYATETYTSAVNMTMITTLVTPYPTTTVTNYETNVYPVNKVFTTTVLVTENPVALYTNPAYAIPQKTQVLAGSEPMVTGGVTVNYPTGFWVYLTAKVFAAPAVTDANGNVACGTLSSFSNVSPTAAACIPTFTGINGNAAANFDSNAGTSVEITLTTPFIHIPTRAGLQISPSEACVQGNGTENYGYPVQQLIDHLAGNAFYSAQYPGIESCIPAGPTIQAVEALAVAVTSSSLDPPAASDPPATSASADPASAAAAASTGSSASGGNGGTTESPGGSLTSMTTITVVVTSTPTLTTTSSSVTSASSAAPSTTSTSIPALPDTTSSSTSSGVEIAISGGLLPTSSTSSSSSSLSSVSPLLETTAPAPASNSTSSSSPSSSSTVISSTSQSSTETSSPSTAEIVLPSSVLVPANTSLSRLTGSVRTVSSTPFVSVPSTTTVPLVVVGSTAPLSTITGLAPVAASSMKDFVPWKLLLGLTGLAAIRVW